MVSANMSLELWEQNEADLLNHGLQRTAVKAFAMLLVQLFNTHSYKKRDQRTTYPNYYS